MSGLSLKELNKIPVRLASGHRLCAGCAESIIARQILMGTEKDVAVSVSTGCFEVSTTIFPYTSWNIPMVHTAFGNGAAGAAGLETAYKSLKRQGKIDKDIKFVNFAGDGATYDIGLQALSGAMERGHDMMFVCFNNEAYMNTGSQKSSLTPFGAKTTTTPAGKNSHGCLTQKKNVFEIIAAHGLPYAATASVGYMNDFLKKLERAKGIHGTRFIHVIAPCPTGWGAPESKMVDLARDVVDCGLWYLAEYEGEQVSGVPGGKFTLNRKPREFASVRDYLKSQGRFRALSDEEISLVEHSRDAKWEMIERDWA